VIRIVPYQEGWPSEFHALADRLRALLGPAALRIDHIGSTAVPGLAAKDIIDIQVTVTDLADPAIEALDRAGFRRIPELVDHAPRGMWFSIDELRKHFFNAPEGERLANVQVRADGRFNQRYALLCRDYLVAHPFAARAYGDVKVALARIVADDVTAYYDVKDPVFDILMTGGNAWAERTQWKPDHAAR
jgi:GrpB-like predicted nucleotidyltransferase (UPF0157 family)